MTDWKKTTDDFAKFLNDTGTQFVKLVSDASSGIQENARKTKQKLELKSQIGEHTRALDKAYQRLGEAYYDALSSHKEVEGMDDVIALIKSNRKIVELLNEKLNALEEKEAAEEKKAASEQEQKDNPADAQTEVKEDDGAKEIHID